MALVFPTHLFGFNDSEIDIERSTLKGGTALSGEQDIVSTDGGGRVFAEFANGPLIDRSPTLAWRALLTHLEEGVTRIIVPFCDARHTPFAPGGPGVPHSDGTPFSDESLYVGDIQAKTNGAYPLRAVAMSIDASMLPRALVGGEWFSINHPNKGWRAYRLGFVTGGDVRFRPPLREAVAPNTPLEFARPRCLMTQDGRASTRKTIRYTPASIRFIEAP